MTAGWPALLRCSLLPSAVHNWNCCGETAVAGDGGTGEPECSDGIWSLISPGIIWTDRGCFHQHCIWNCLTCISALLYGLSRALDLHTAGMGSAGLAVTWEHL